MTCCLCASWHLPDSTADLQVPLLQFVPAGVGDHREQPNVAASNPESATVLASSQSQVCRRRGSLRFGWWGCLEDSTADRAARACSCASTPSLAAPRWFLEAFSAVVQQDIG